jgi:uncharacterized protein YbcV (DUF1398 family)
MRAAMKANQFATLAIIWSMTAACNSVNQFTTKNQNQMFTAEQIKATLSEVRTGADFPRIAMKLKNLGISHYVTRIETGQSVFYGAHNHEVHIDAAYDSIKVADRVNAGQLQSDIKAHQEGESGYFQISRQSADNGIAKWAVDLEQMTCSYLDKAGKQVYMEHIPVSRRGKDLFTIEQIKAVHAKVKSGADFPAYVQEMKGLGVTSYEHYIMDGHILYHGSNGFTLLAASKWPPVEIADTGNEEYLKYTLAIHQQGGTDYGTFCREAAHAGVERWTVDMQGMTCTYYDKSGNRMLIEQIPEP